MVSDNWNCLKVFMLDFKKYENQNEDMLLNCQLF